MTVRKIHRAVETIPVESAVSLPTPRSADHTVPWFPPLEALIFP